MRLPLPARLVQWSWIRTGRPSLERLVGDVDVVHATNFVLPALDKTPGVVTVHDLAFLREDTFPGGERLRKLVPWSVQRAARVIVPTRAVAAEVADGFRMDEKKIVVTHEGVSPLFFGATPLADTVLAGMGIQRPFVLAVGTLEPRKNLARLLEAWAALRSQLPDWMLVLAGPEGWGPKLPLSERVIRTGFLAEETLPGLLAAAEVFCYPSLYEGFGLPPLEAMAAGTPALVGRYTAAEEVAGDAALLVDPRDTDELAAGLHRLALDGELRSRLALAGKARAAAFTWEATARSTLKVYDEVTKGT